MCFKKKNKITTFLEYSISRIKDENEICVKNIFLFDKSENQEK
jgi:hypothetical protein